MVADYYREQGVLSRISKNREEGFRPWERVVVAQHHHEGGREFLVIGGGAGRESGALAERGFSVVSVDRSAQLTEAGRRIAGENERFWCLQLPEEPVPPHRFDHAALWSQVLANIPGPERRRETLAVAARSLRHGGRLSFSVHEVERTLALVDDSTQVEPIGGEGSGDFVMRLPAEAPCYWHFFTRAEITELVASAGLVLDLLLMASELGDEDRGNLMIGLCHRPAEAEASTGGEEARA